MSPFKFHPDLFDTGYYWIKYQDVWMIGELDCFGDFDTFDYSYPLNYTEVEEIGEKIVRR